MTGFSVSLIVTLKEHEPVFPDASVAVQFTVVLPFAKVEPEAGVQELVAPGHLSGAVTLQVTLLFEHWPLSVLAAMLAGQVMPGFSVSLMVTVKAQEAVLPEASVAVQFTGVVPLGKVDPAGGTQAVVTPAQL